ncbi:unnamed protein product, partial [Polarella glacialis]
DFPVAEFDYFGESWSAWCLVPASKANESMPAAVAEAYGGEGLGCDFGLMCVPDPEKVPLTAAGFEAISRQGDEHRVASFIDRVVKHLGGAVSDGTILATFAERYTLNAKSPTDEPGEEGRALKTFSRLLEELAAEPTWASWNSSASCVADRDSNAPAVGAAIGLACGGLSKNFDCDEIPEECRGSVWDVADYVFGAYWSEHKGTSLQNCYFGGAATLAGTTDRLAESNAKCVVPVEWAKRRRLQGRLSSEGESASKVRSSSYEAMEAPGLPRRAMAADLDEGEEDE